MIYLLGGFIVYLWRNFFTQINEKVEALGDKKPEMSKEMITPSESSRSTHVFGRLNKPDLPKS